MVETTDPSKDKVSMTAPSSVEAGLVRITLRNRGDTLHDAQLFRIDGEHTATDLNYGLLEKVDSAAKPKWAHPEGGVAPLRPGENATVTQVLEPGRYFIADTQERETAVGGKSVNAVKGGIAELEVTGEGGGELPKTPVTVTARDDGFDAKGLRPGANRVTFVNAGEELHQVVAFPVAPGLSYRQAANRLLQREAYTGWVPVDVPHTRATTVLESGQRQITVLDLPRGRYLFGCFVSDRAGGPPHLSQTMTAVEVG